MRKLTTLRVTDVRDREVMGWLRDAAVDGWASSRDVVDSVGRSAWADPDTAHRMVAIRFSWLWRYGALYREHLTDERGELRFRKNGQPFYGQRWSLTDIGQRWLDGSLNAAQIQNELDAEYEGADEELRALIRRAFRYTAQTRS